jgi:hypothetical protein
LLERGDAHALRPEQADDQIFTEQLSALAPVIANL